MFKRARDGIIFTMGSHALSLLAPDVIQGSHQMHENLLRGSSRLCHYSCIYHCSPFTSNMHNHPSLLYRYFSFIQCFFHTVHPSHSWPSSQPNTYHNELYYSLHQPVLHSLHVSKPPQHILLCSTSTSFFLTQPKCSTLHIPLKRLHYI